MRPAAFPQMRDDAPVLAPDVAFRAGPVDARLRDRLAHLVLDAFRVANEAPETIAGTAALRSLQEQLVDATEQAVRGLRVESEHPGRPRIDRGRLLDGALQVIREHADETIHISDLCTQCGVSAATLRDAFEEQLHIGPHHYLMLYRMHAIRRALMLSPDETVASVCGRFGVWEFGRFAAQYRCQFGESPTETLRKPR